VARDTHPADRERTDARGRSPSRASAITRSSTASVDGTAPTAGSPGAPWLCATTPAASSNGSEEELRQAKELREVALQSSNLSIWEYDMPDGALATSRLTLTNVWESLGYRGPVSDRGAIASLIHREDLEPMSRRIHAYLAEGGAFETEHRVLHENVHVSLCTRARHGDA
jgi:hypothetical protein